MEAYFLHWWRRRVYNSVQDEVAHATGDSEESETQMPTVLPCHQRAGRPATCIALAVALAVALALGAQRRHIGRSEDAVRTSLMQQKSLQLPGAGGLANLLKRALPHQQQQPPTSVTPVQVPNNPATDPDSVLPANSPSPGFLLVSDKSKIADSRADSEGSGSSGSSNKSGPEHSQQYAQQQVSTQDAQQTAANSVSAGLMEQQAPSQNTQQTVATPATNTDINAGLPKTGIDAGMVEQQAGTQQTESPSLADPQQANVQSSDAQLQSQQQQQQQQQQLQQQQPRNDDEGLPDSPQAQDQMQNPHAQLQDAQYQEEAQLQAQQQPELPCGRMQDKTDYPGNDLGVPLESASAEDCCQRCAKELNCVAWTRVKANKVCFLKGKRPRWALSAIYNADTESGMPTQVDRSIPSITRKPGQSIYCFSLMLPWGYEKGLLQMQYRRGASIFGCDEYTVYSNQEIKVAEGVVTKVVDSDLKCKMGGEFKTCLNTPVFMAVWDRIFKDNRPRLHDWTVKADPDAVFFPSRLRDVLVHHKETARGTYLNNCKMGMHGPLEVFSRNAVAAWGAGRPACRAHFNKLCSGECQWGEDMFIDQCMWKVLKLQRVFEPSLLVEDHCKPPPGWKDCKDTTKVSFHPFKDVDKYKECMSVSEQENEKDRSNGVAGA